MTRHFPNIRILLVTALAMVACPLYAEELQQTSYQELEWTALIPQDDLDALLDPPDYLMTITDGSQQDSVEVFSGKELTDDKTKRFQQALTSTRVMTAYDGKAIRLPGFIVPLESDDEKKVTAFFIVPYFGACLHMPPPPPNQIIYATLPRGLALESLYQPFWFEGKLAIETQKNTLGTAAYRLHLDNISLYEDS